MINKIDILRRIRRELFGLIKGTDAPNFSAILEVLIESVETTVLVISLQFLAYSIE